MTKSVLIVGPSWVGDMVMAQSLFKLLKQRDLDTVIDVLAPDWTHPLLKRMPEVRHALPYPFAHGELGLLKRWRLGKELRAENYDQAIVLPNSLKSAIVPFAARAKRRTGFRGEMRYGLLNDIRPLDKKALYKTVERFLFLGLESRNERVGGIPQPRLQYNPKNVPAIFQKFGLELSSKPVLGICPGAEYGSAKRWPPEYFVEVAKYCLERDWQVWLFGSDKDHEVTEKIEKDLEGNCVNLAGKTRLAEAIDLMSSCDAVVTNDSGLMHIAAAVDVNVVAIFGSSDPEHTPPLTDKADILYLGLKCSPCFKRECPLGHTNCLKQIMPKKVINSVLRT